LLILAQFLGKENKKFPSFFKVSLFKYIEAKSNFYTLSEIGGCCGIERRGTNAENQRR